MKTRTDILRITRCEVRGATILRLTFSDGERKDVDVGPLLRGPVFAPLREPAFFRRAQLDDVTGTVVWPNGVDIAPEALQALPPASPRRGSGAARR